MQIVFISFKADVIQEAKKLYPSIPTYWLYAFKEEEKPDIKKLIKVLTTCQADGLSTNVNMYLDTKFIQSINDEGYGYHAWTINSTQQAKTLRDWGVLSITTDKVEEIQTALSE